MDEYVAMFALSGDDLKKSILGCGDGPASFNASLTKKGGRVLSVDPLYRLSKQAMQRRIDETFEKVIQQTQENQHEFVWATIKSVEELGRLRMAAMREFLSDFPAGKKAGRYVDAELPKLPFADREFDLALCSHLLFLYGAQLSEAFHLASILELCRVASEVRIFPLLELGARVSRHFEPIRAKLRSKGYGAEIIPVDYEFQRGGNQMMRVTTSLTTSAFNRSGF
jgi:hypothetical protein